MLQIKNHFERSFLKVQLDDAEGFDQSRATCTWEMFGVLCPDKRSVRFLKLFLLVIYSFMNNHEISIYQDFKIQKQNYF